MENNLDDTDPTHPGEARRILMERVREHAEEVERNRQSWGRGTADSDPAPHRPDGEPA